MLLCFYNRYEHINLPKKWSLCHAEKSNEKVKILLCFYNRYEHINLPNKWSLCHAENM